MNHPSTSSTTSASTPSTIQIMAAPLCPRPQPIGWTADCLDDNRPNTGAQNSPRNRGIEVSTPRRKCRECRGPLARPESQQGPAVVGETLLRSADGVRCLPQRGQLGLAQLPLDDLLTPPAPISASTPGTP